MTIKTRLWVLAICIVAFLIMAPYIVLYSLGYRVNFSTWQLRATGGIYVYAEPEPSLITIDTKSAPKTSYFSSAVFLQNLMPGTHTVMITKEGYYDYQKNLDVREKEVTKLENVTLFKKDFGFSLLPSLIAENNKPAQTAQEQFALLSHEPISAFSLKKNTLYVTGQATPAIKNVVAYTVKNQTITWLAQDGLLYESDTQTIAPKQLTTIPFTLKSGAQYTLTIMQNLTFLQENLALFSLNIQTKTFQLLDSNMRGLKHSPDHQKIAYFSDHQIFISTAKTNHQTRLLLDKYSDIILDLQWVNNDYIVIATKNSVIITEIDNRGNINAITLSTPPVTNNQGTITLKSPQIFFNQQNKKLYIATQKEVLVSEKLLP